MGSSKEADLLTRECHRAKRCHERLLTCPHCKDVTPVRVKHPAAIVVCSWCGGHFPACQGPAEAPE